MTAEDTGRFASIDTLPALPTPGAGSRLLIAVTVIALRVQGHPDDVVDQWRTEALAALRSPSPTDSLAPEGKH